MPTNQSRIDGIVSGDIVGSKVNVLGHLQKVPQSRLESQIMDLRELAITGIHYQASITFAQIPATANPGDLYDISEDFITDSRFSEGAGIECLAGTDIVYNKNGKWDLFANSAISAIRELKRVAITGDAISNPAP